MIVPDSQGEGSGDLAVIGTAIDESIQYIYLTVIGIDILPLDSR
jgi:hypothetical protein